MAKQLINTGLTANDGTGDTLNNISGTGGNTIISRLTITELA